MTGQNVIEWIVNLPVWIWPILAFLLLFHFNKHFQSSMNQSLSLIFQRLNEIGHALRLVWPLFAVYAFYLVAERFLELSFGPVAQ